MNGTGVFAKIFSIRWLPKLMSVSNGLLVSYVT